MEDTQSKWMRELGNIVEMSLPYAVAAGGILGLLLLEGRMLANGRSRYFYLFIAVLGVVWVLLLTIQKVRKLRAAEGEQRTRMQARTKLLAEVFAAMAIVSFLGLYFRAGYELDVSNYRARWGYLNQAAVELSQVLPEDQCPRFPVSDSCKRVWSSVRGLQGAIGTAKEADVYKLMDSASAALDEVSLRSTSAKQEAFRIIRGNLGDAVIDERELSVVLQVLQLFAIAFAVSAISRKLALAWIDYQEKMAKAT